jgi:hypothetical protein
VSNIILVIPSESLAPYLKKDGIHFTIGVTIPKEMTFGDRNDCTWKEFYTKNISGHVWDVKKNKIL